MKRILLAFLLFSTSLFVTAKENKKDPYSEAYLALNEPVRAFYIATEAYEEYVDRGLYEYAGKLAFLAGYAAYKSQEFDKAAKWYAIAKPHAAGEISKGIVEYSLGEMYRKVGLLNEAIETSKNASYLLVKEKKYEWAAMSLYSAALAYHNTGIYSDAIPLLENSLKYDTIYDAVILLSDCYQKLELQYYYPKYGKVFDIEDKSEISDIKFDFSKIDELHAFLNNSKFEPVKRANYLRNRGFYFLVKGNKEKAESYFKEVLNLVPNTSDAASIYYQLGKYHFFIDEKSIAKTYIDSALSIPFSSDDWKFYKSLVAFADDIFSGDEISKKQFQAYSAYIEFANSRFKQLEVVKEVVGQQKIYEGEVEARIKLAEENATLLKRNNRLYITLSVCIFIIAAILIYVLVTNYRKKLSAVSKTVDKMNQKVESFKLR